MKTTTMQLILTIMALAVTSSSSFTLTAPMVVRPIRPTGLSAKGFGTEESPKKKIPTPSTTNDTPTSTSPTPAPLNAGQKALAELRRQKAEEKDAELRKVREMLQADQEVANTPAAIPEQVAQRMGQRMLPFVGIPLFLGLSSFVGFWYMAVYQNMEFQPVLVAGTSGLLLVIALLGITYSVMSTSWDVEAGDSSSSSLLGIDEFQKNVGNVKEGLARSRENAILRDKVSGLSDNELQSALKDLDKREKAKSSGSSLQDKLQDELD